MTGGDTKPPPEMGTLFLADPRICLRVGITPTRKTPSGVQTLSMVCIMTIELPNLDRPDWENGPSRVVSISLSRPDWVRLLWAADVLCQFLALVPFPADSLARIRHSVKLLELPNLDRPDWGDGPSRVISVSVTRPHWVRLLWAADVLCQFLSLVPSFPADSLARIRHSVKLLHLALYQ